MYTPSVEQPIANYLYFTFLIAIRYFALAVGSFVLFWKILGPKKIAHLKIVKTLLPKGQILLELKYSFISFFVFAVGAIFNFYVNKLNWGLYYSDIDSRGKIYWVFSVLAALFLNDTHFYWMHRALHKGVFYRKIHFLHHLSKQTTPLTSQSFHWVEAFGNISIVFILPFILPMHFSAYIVFTFLAFIFNIYAHCGFEFFPEKWHKKGPLRFLNLSSLHQLHHEKSNVNFGLYFTFWDWALKTLRYEEKN